MSPWCLSFVVGLGCVVRQKIEHRVQTFAMFRLVIIASLQSADERHMFECGSCRVGLNEPPPHDAKMLQSADERHMFECSGLSRQRAAALGDRR